VHQQTASYGQDAEYHLRLFYLELQLKRRPVAVSMAYPLRLHVPAGYVPELRTFSSSLAPLLKTWMLKASNVSEEVL
jgi:hypothetical protein